MPGCWGPSWDSFPSSARRWKSSAWRLEMERKGGEYRGTPMPSYGKGRQANKGHIFCTSSEKILFPTLIKHSLNSRDAKKTATSTKSLTVSQCLLTLLARSNEANHGATTEVAMVRMIHGHLKYCQTRSKTINGLTLLRASKIPAQHVGRLDCI